MKFLLLFLCVIGLGASELTTEMLDIEKDEGYIAYKKGTKQKAEGVLKTYYDDNTSLKESIPLVKGQINGTYTLFYQSSILQAKIDYVNSQRTGKHIAFYEDGKKAYEADMKNEKKEGHVKQWHKNGKLNYDVVYKDNKIEGLVKVYADDGSIESITEYKNGKVSKQIQPKKPDNKMLQTRALATYGNGKDIYYLFISPICPFCNIFLSQIEKFKDKATFYVYLVPLKNKDEQERKMLDLVYREDYSGERLQVLFDLKAGKIDLNQEISPEETYVNNSEILKAQQIQYIMDVRQLPALIDTKGFKHVTSELFEKYKLNK